MCPLSCCYDSTVIVVVGDLKGSFIFVSYLKCTVGPIPILKYVYIIVKPFCVKKSLSSFDVIGNICSYEFCKCCLPWKWKRKLCVVILYNHSSCSQLNWWWIGKQGPGPWSARSPDINPIDFLCRRHVRSFVYATPI